MERPAKEELVNGLTHAIGTALSLIGAVYLIQRVYRDGNVQTIIACSLYSASLIAVYFTSTMSHWEPNEARKAFYRRLDQAFIYFLIVGSFTPFCVVYFRGTYFWILLAMMWIIAIGGFVSKLWAAHRVQSVAIWIYLGLGWMPVMAFVPWLIGIKLEPMMPIGCVWMVVLGGVLYSVGTIFLYQDQKGWYVHALWHFCVMLGSVVHYWAIVKYVA